MHLRPPSREHADGYDDEAERCGWLGPAVTFGLAFMHIEPGWSVLDLGIGTGLGSAPFHRAGCRVTGMDISEEMLGACRTKGWAAQLVRHDLAVTPYPFQDASFDCVVSTGVFQFFRDLAPIFREVSRLLRDGGVFAFVTGDRARGKEQTVVVGPGFTGTRLSVTMYCHAIGEVAGWLETSGLRPVDTLEFTAWMDPERSLRFPVRAYLARKERSVRAGPPGVRPEGPPGAPGEREG